ncbi:hypothetical protein H4219_005299 [Mycoemilia scoparia]|uniref:Uncharacterized protein n=1 Tax=Mycoemilia scoparia TaxID=417184 RepID=A0A9W7ZTJ9_9FUNG|nr:hypothetical protein H4219_005299 [Mycoemilia scoparia]
MASIEYLVYRNLPDGKEYCGDEVLEAVTNALKTISHPRVKFEGTYYTPDQASVKLEEAIKAKKNVSFSFTRKDKDGNLVDETVSYAFGYTLDV